LVCGRPAKGGRTVPDHRLARKIGGTHASAPTDGTRWTLQRRPDPNAIPATLVGDGSPHGAASDTQN
jgi:hypothetical protein